MNPQMDAMKELDLEDQFFESKFLGKYSDCYQVPEEHHERVRISDLCILLQEFSRKSMNWPTIKLGKLKGEGNGYKFESDVLKLELNAIEIPFDVYNLMISNPNLILAGGSVVDLLLQRKVRDYDLFCISSRPNNFRTENWIETCFSISTLEKPKIQLIKRIYDNPQQVIGKKKKRKKKI